MNPFEALAEAQTPRPVKVRQQAAAKAAQTREAKRQEEEEKELLLKLFLAGQREEREALLNGPVGAQVKGLLSFARNMTLQDAGKLIEVVRRATWIIDLSIDDRFVVLSLINQAIVNLRVRNGLEPLSDALWGEEPKAYEVIKTLMGLDGK